MPYLIVSDLHGNLEALEAVLAAAAGRYDSIVCCGDLVGYGADPNATVEWARTNVSAIVRGNHDKASCGLSDAEDFNALAKFAALWTRAQLTPENLAYLRALQSGPVRVDGFVMVHGSVADEDEYVFSAEHAAMVFPQLDSTVTLFGHTHLQGGFVRHGLNAVRTIHRLYRPGMSNWVLEMSEREQYLLNPGSVGQPRDGDPRAAFAIFNPEPRPGVVEYCRVDYDVQSAQQKIRDAGLPPRLADRLSVGR